MHLLMSMLTKSHFKLLHCLVTFVGEELELIHEPKCASPHKRESSSYSLCGSVLQRIILIPLRFVTHTMIFIVIYMVIGFIIVITLNIQGKSPKSRNCEHELVLVPLFFDDQFI